MSLAPYVAAGFAALDKLAEPPAPISVPTLACMAGVSQFIGLTAQGLRCLARGGKSSGQGDPRVLRTPEGYFEGLDAFPFAPHYFEHDGCRLHYLDEGPNDASEVVLLIHGMPTWSYLYRKVIPPLVAEGYRVLALDFCGMGKSDKPVDSTKYSFASHVASISALVTHLRINHPCVTLVIHDWGGVIGQAALPTLAKVQSRLVVLNTLGVGPSCMGLKGMLCFFIWQGACRVIGRALPIADLCAGGAGGPNLVSAKAAAGYGAPFPSTDYKALAAIWPLAYNDLYRVWKQYYDALCWAQDNLTAPILVAFANEDVIVDGARADNFYKSWMKRSKAVESVAIPNASHFLQEANPSAVSTAIITFIKKH
ncbi:unnamed protein product [Polarella glacialis]|uniref:AB hydrolase-1 domain-containing protein n=1 Tax=Polarella glacialis TaxID=89957 RepID=A0A813J7S7_POLGL|nr:unnamed protein product [Polarella glacialis]CAE8668519.1 unnamed protein product [Polarella glacialis]